MLANQNTVLVGDKVILVPYMVEHVAKYHEWMCNSELRELTASEQLTIDEEYEMQRKWREDADKLTFIILARPPTAPISPPLTPSLFASDPHFSTFPMIGDVNLFFKGSPPGDEEAEFEVEVEVMIAEPAYRREGRAREALELLFDYATYSAPSPVSDDRDHAPTDAITPMHVPVPSIPTNVHASQPLPIPRTALVTRICETNMPSIRLFQKLGFEVVKRVEVFREVEMRWGV